MVPQQQVPGILAAQADAAGVPEISGTVPAQRMAVWGGGGRGNRRHKVSSLHQRAEGTAITPLQRRHQESSPKAGHPRKGDV